MVALVDSKFTGLDITSLRCAVIEVADPQRAFISLIPDFYSPYPSHQGVHPSASIHPSVSLGVGVSIGPGCVIGESSCIGDNVRLDANVVVYPGVSIRANSHVHSGCAIREGCLIGSHCVIHNNVVIGADGFGYLSDPKTGISKVPQVGIVEIGDHVEIGACTSIDRGTVGATIIGSHVKIDNQVQIGHNVRVDSHSIICAQVGIAGSCHIQRGVVLGGGVGVADHVTIASGSRVGGHAGVISSIEEPGDYMGFPAMKASQFRRQQAILRRLAHRKSVKTSEQ
jgi:UDP-3-O-[3-hydroxymyristoyl] glucosamine N-acyltransferase